LTIEWGVPRTRASGDRSTPALDHELVDDDGACGQALNKRTRLTGHPRVDVALNRRTAAGRLTPFACGACPRRSSRSVVKRSAATTSPSRLHGDRSAEGMRIQTRGRRTRGAHLASRERPWSIQACNRLAIAPVPTRGNPR
jgi:hypothetical protein